MIRKISIIFILCLLFLPFRLVRAQDESTLSLQPASTKRRVGEIFALEIKINAIEKILGADIDVSYQPSILELQKIAPGNFFPNPQVLVDKIDPQKGTANFSIFSFPLQQGNATVATLLFKTLKETTQSAQIQFEPTTTLATVGDRKILFKTIPATIEISPQANISIPTLQPMPSPPVSSISPPPSPTSTPKAGFLVSLAKPLGMLLIIGGIITLVLVFVLL